MKSFCKDNVCWRRDTIIDSFTYLKFVEQEMHALEDEAPNIVEEKIKKLWDCERRGARQK